MDTHIGDLLPLITGSLPSPTLENRTYTNSAFVDREIEIIQALLERTILPFADAICRACEVCAELDVLLAFADAATSYGYVRPDMREAWEDGGGDIRIRNGRYGFRLIGLRFCDLQGVQASAAGTCGRCVCC